MNKLQRVRAYQQPTNVRPIRKQSAVLAAFLLPASIVTILVLGYPVVSVVTDSITDQSNSFTLSNFVTMFQDDLFWTSLKHNGVILLSIPVRIIIALVACAVLFKGLKAAKVYQFLLFLPFIPSIAAAGVAFLYILNVDGPINSLLSILGLDFLRKGWLTDDSLQIWTISGVVLWTRVGFCVVLIMARLMSLEYETFEAAFIDGAGWYRAFWHIALPELKGTIQFLAILGSIEAFSWSFAYVYILSGGARSSSSSILEIYLYRSEFMSGQPGLAAAIATVLVAIAGVIALVRVALTRKDFVE